MKMMAADKSKNASSDMAGLGQAAAAMKNKIQKREKDAVQSVKKMVSPSKHGKVKKMHVHVNDDKTFSMEHEHEPQEDGAAPSNTTHSAQDLDGLMDHMQQHLGPQNLADASGGEAPEGSEAPAAPAAA